MYLVEVKPENSRNELQYQNIGRKYYSHKKPDFSSHKFQSTDIDWPFTDKYLKSQISPISQISNISNLS